MQWMFPFPQGLGGCSEWTPVVVLLMCRRLVFETATLARAGAVRAMFLGVAKMIGREKFRDRSRLPFRTVVWQLMLMSLSPPAHFLEMFPITDVSSVCVALVKWQLLEGVDRWTLSFLTVTRILGTGGSPSLFPGFPMSMPVLLTPYLMFPGSVTGPPVISDTVTSSR